MRKILATIVLSVLVCTGAETAPAAAEAVPAKAAAVVPAAAPAVPAAAPEVSTAATAVSTTAPAVSRGSSPKSKTLFQYAEGAWAVGTIHLGKAMTFRDGKVLVFPGMISDLLWAPDGTKPRNLMLVHEVASDDKDKPFFKEGDEIFAPIRLLPEHSYWKDNLPNTRRHEVAGGRRYVFRGEEAVEVRKILDAYLKAYDSKGAARWTGELAAVAGALGSGIVAVREDAVHYLEGYPTLARDLDDRALAPLAAYLGGTAPGKASGDAPSNAPNTAPNDEKAGLVSALVAAKATAVKPLLADLAKRDDATGAIALQGLQGFGETPPVDRLLALSRSKSIEMRTYAAGALGLKAASDEAAFARATEILGATAEPVPVREAAAQGLGAFANDKIAAVLADATKRGDDASRGAAVALAASGNPAAASLLSGILVTGKGEAAVAAAIALGQMKNCPECVSTLREQLKSHHEDSVRNLIGVLLEIPLVHKH